MPRPLSRRIRPLAKKPLSRAAQARLSAMRDELWRRAVLHETILAIRRGDACAAPCLQPPPPANP